MILYLINHSCKYECENICRIYYPTEKIITVISEENKTDSSETENNTSISIETKKIITKVSVSSDSCSFFVSASIDGKSGQNEFVCPISEVTENRTETELARLMCGILSQLTGITPSWGVLTGVRPSKLLRRLIKDMGQEKALDYFTGYLQVQPQKAQLALSVAKAEQAAIDLSQPNSFSLYISIPFCPTRCSYCSFVSHSIAQAKKLIPDYVRLLCEEISSIAKIAENTGLKLETVYIGGGTPTSLSAEQLETIINSINGSFDMKNTREFTVEAGRPDTITPQKLAVLKNGGVTRISINPQSFNDKVLETIGRKHTSADTEDKFMLARSMGFDNINMDFIAGLPGDNPESFFESILRATELSPENITVHTLALKRASTLVSQAEYDRVCRQTSVMVEFANKTLLENGYVPYYMYRQSKSVGNLENVGWCKPNRECLYNIYMMEEIHTVLAAGGGAVTKLKAPVGEKIERIYNFKYPYEYISRFEEQNERKSAIPVFYSANS